MSTHRVMCLKQWGQVGLTSLAEASIRPLRKQVLQDRSGLCQRDGSVGEINACCISMRTWIWSTTHTSPRLREGTCLKKKGEDQKRKAVSINCWPYIHVHTHENTDTHSTYMCTHMNTQTRTPHTWFLTSQKYYFVLKKTVLKYAACCLKKFLISYTI